MYIKAVTEESFSEVKDIHIEEYISLTLKKTLEKYLAPMYIFEMYFGILGKRVSLLPKERSGYYQIYPQQYSRQQWKPIFKKQLNK